MDHYGFLALARQLAINMTAQQEQIRNRPLSWNWCVTPVVYPESKCPFCHGVIRSNGIWFLTGERYRSFVGVLFPKEGAKVELVHPSHPHMNSSTEFCLGRHPDGISLLAGEPNLSDSSMGSCYMPRWLKLYWGHTCQASRDFLISRELHATLAELDKI